MMTSFATEAQCLGPVGSIYNHVLITNPPQ